MDMVNILSLFYEDNFKNYNTFPKIPSGKYGSYSPRHFSFVFFGSTFLYDAKELKLPNDATESCYYNTFQGCTSLTTAPELPATTLSKGCYESMFDNCTSLMQAPELPATTIATNCYSRMFFNCDSLTKAPKLPTTTLANGCYSNMFYGCTSLVQAPELPATTLQFNCYSNMFRGCSHLNYVKAMFITNQRLDTYLQQWLDYVSSTGTFVKNKDATWSNTDVGIPTGWTVETV